jgi:ribokinase
MGQERGVAQVIVVGSVNADYSVRISHLPQPGETVTGGTLAVMQGGKGANQAHAAARLGAAVSFVAAVGDDSAGDSAAADLASAGIDLGGLLRSGEPTGVAVILVDAEGENMIAVAPGANAGLTAADVTRLLDGRITADSVVLACLEVPLATVTAAARAAAAGGATMVINPAPGQPLPAGLVAGAILTPNEGELLRLPGQDGAAQDAAGEQAAVDWLLAAGARAVIVTRGSRGATLFRAGHEPASFPAPRIEVVDTVGAGDAFNGGLATALAAGLSLETAVTVAVAAGAAACTGAGPRQALPRAADIPVLRTAPGLLTT